jgi:hypothetical protein
MGNYRPDDEDEQEQDDSTVPDKLLRLFKEPAGKHALEEVALRIWRVLTDTPLLVPCSACHVRYPSLIGICR